MEATAGEQPTSNAQKDFLNYSFPKTLSKNLDRRVELLDEAKENVFLQKRLVAQCERDITFFFNFFLWTFNPKVEPKSFPFVLFPRQAKLAKAYLKEIKEGRGSLTEKSREVGATYICLAVHLHQWLFADGFESLILSLREDEVDNPTASSLFGKLRYMLARLPPWMRPIGLKIAHETKFLNLINPENGNSIVGQATTPDAGRSGRKTAVLVDEYAFITPKILLGLENGLNETTNCIQRISTPKGINQFKAIRDRKMVIVHTFHWTKIPAKLVGGYFLTEKGKKVLLKGNLESQITPYGFLKDSGDRATKFKIRSNWYDSKCKDYLNARDIAQELDLNYLGSGFCRFDSDMIQGGSARTRDGKRGRLEMVDGKPEFFESDPGTPFEIEVWRFPTLPLYNYRSVIGSDVAEGLEKGDYSVADVLQQNIEGTEVYHSASLHGHFAPDVWAEKLNILGLWYDEGAELAVERNKDGLGVLLNLRNDHSYINIFRAGDDGRDGFLTKQSNKFTITGDLDEALKKGELKTDSINHFTELSMFENNDGKLGATGQNHDDRVMSMAIGWHCIKQFRRPVQKVKMSKPRKQTGSFDTSKY